MWGTITFAWNFDGTLAGQYLEAKVDAFMSDSQYLHLSFTVHVAYPCTETIPGILDGGLLMIDAQLGELVSVELVGLAGTNDSDVRYPDLCQIDYELLGGEQFAQIEVDKDLDTLTVSVSSKGDFG